MGHSMKGKTSLLWALPVCALVLAALGLRECRVAPATLIAPPAGPAGPPVANLTPGVARASGQGEPSAAAKKRPLQPLNTNPHLSWFLLIREELNQDFGDKIDQNGIRSAYSFVLTILDNQGKTLRERVRRAYAVRLLAYVAVKQPELRGEVLSHIEERITDGDPYTRLVSVATLLDYPVTFTTAGDPPGHWILNTGVRLFPNGTLYDATCTNCTLAKEDHLRGILLRALAQESIGENRAVIFDVLGAEPSPGDLDVLLNAAIHDGHSGARLASIRALGRMGSSTPASQTLLAASQSDPVEEIRREALYSLVSLGSADQAIVDRLLGMEPKDAGAFQALGRAQALAQSPQIRAFLVDQLRSPTVEIRRRAVESAILSKDSNLVANLKTTLESETDAGIKKKLKKGISDLESSTRKP